MIDWDVFNRENPDLEVHDPVLLGEGWCCIGYGLGNDLVVKVPKADEWDEIESEVVFLERYAEMLPLSVPRPVRSRQDSDASPYGYAIYTRVPGNILDMELVDANIASRDLGEFLKALHNLPVMPEHPFAVEDSRYLVAESERLYKATVDQHLLSKKACSAIELVIRRHQARYSNPKPLVLLHKDFGPSNLLMHDGRVTGVIDFANVTVGDSDADFVDIWENMGETVLRGVAEAYGHPDPNNLLEKVRDFSTVKGLEVLVDDADSAPPGVWDDLHASFESRFSRL